MSTPKKTWKSQTKYFVENQTEPKFREGKKRFCFISKPNTPVRSKMLFFLLEQPPGNEAKAGFICNIHLMNSGGLMMLLGLIKAVLGRLSPSSLGRAQCFGSAAGIQARAQLLAGIMES